MNKKQTRDPGQEQTASTVSILLIDSHALTRSCLGAILVRADRRFTAYGYGCVEETATEDLPPIDLILWNLGSTRITDETIAGQLDRLSETYPDIPLVILSKHDDPGHALDAVRLGARGCIPASLSASVMIAALRLILVGGVYVAPISMEAASRPGTASASSAIVPRAAEEQRDLTHREEEVLTLLRQGKPNKLIAYELRMSENTVKVHVCRIIKKLHVMNRTEAAYACNGRMKMAPAELRVSAS